jgi:soluble lytic murein transglycosylase-like protein
MIGNLRYVMRLSQSILTGPKGAAEVTTGRTPVALLGLGLSLIALAVVADQQFVVAEPSPSTVPDLRARVAFIYRHLGGFAKDGEREVSQIEQILLDYRRDRELAGRIATALVREGHQTGVDPRMLLAVLLVENPDLDPDARSTVGAIGLMQVMPFHSGQWKPCAGPLDDIDANICHGARIFAHYMGATNGNVDRALLRYNGCVNGTNTPDCARYPTHVFARAGRASLGSWKMRPASAAGR